MRVQGAEAPPPIESILQDIYDAMAIALEVGRYDELEQSAKALVEAHRPMGYTLSSLLGIVALLKSNLWLAITAAFNAENALSQLQGLDFVFSHLATKISLAEIKFI